MTALNHIINIIICVVTFTFYSSVEASILKNTNSKFIEEKDTEPLFHPVCEGGCQGLESKTTFYQCSLEGNPVPCNGTICPNTIIKVKCKPAQRLPKGNNKQMSAVCLPNGKLNNELSECVQDCGKQNPLVEQALVAHGEKTLSGEFPWHVGIYSFNNISKTWQHICGGTIITSNIILTAAHCVVSEFTTLVVDPGSLKVAAGKYYRDWYADELFKQIADIKEIIMPDRYGGQKLFYQQDITMLELDTNLNFSEVIMPCCVDWKLENQIVPGQLSTVVGWGQTEYLIPSPVLLSAQLPLLDYKSCETVVRHEGHLSYLTQDKFCAGYTNGTSVDEGDSGGGLTVQMGDRHYIYGIVSVMPKISNTVAFFTNVTNPHHLAWLQRYLFWSERRLLYPELIAQKGQCLIPAAPSYATFTVSGCAENDTSNMCRGLENIPVNNNTYLEYTCKEGYEMLFNPNNRSYCRDEFWTSIPVCDELCPPLKSEVIRYACFDIFKRRIPCDDYMLPGSSAIFNCLVSSGSVVRSICDLNGKWDSVLETCSPVCGKRKQTSEKEPTSPEAFPVHFSEFPWYIGIYKKSNDGIYKFLCPGTLISYLGIITSARCVYDANKDDTIDTKLLKIVAGKKNFEWEVLNDEQEIHGISDIFLPEGYNKTYFDSFQSDTAVLIMDGTFEVNSTYHYQSCLNVNLRIMFPRINELGIVAGWGITSDSPSQRNFEKVSLPFITIDECRRRFGSQEILRYLSDDKFCLLHKDGFRIKKDISGSGLFFMKDGYFYIFGVGSFIPSDQNEFSVFTNIIPPGIWISKILTNSGLQYMLDRGFQK